MSDTAAPAETTQVARGGFLSEALSAIQEQNPNAASLGEAMRSSESQQQVVEQKAEPPKTTTEKQPIKFSANPLDDFSEEKKEVVEESEFDSSEIDQKYADKPENITDPKALAKWGDLKGDLRSERSRSHQLNRSLAQKDQDIQNLKAKLEEIQASGGDGNEWKQKYESIKQKDARLALEEDDDFNNNVRTPYQTAVNHLNEFVEAFAIPQADLNAALSTPNRIERNRKLTAVLDATDMDAMSRDDFKKALGDYEGLKGKYEEMQTKAAEIYEGTIAKRQQEKDRQSQERVTKLQEVEPEVFDKVSKNPIFKEVFNGSSGELREMVKKNLTTENPPAIAVFEKLASFAHRPLMDALTQKNERIKELEETLARHVGGGVAVGAKPALQTDEPTTPSGPRGTDLAEALRQANGGRDTWGNMG